MLLTRTETLLYTVSRRISRVSPSGYTVKVCVYVESELEWDCETVIDNESTLHYITLCCAMLCYVMMCRTIYELLYHIMMRYGV